MCPYQATNDKRPCNQFYPANIGSKPTQATKLVEPNQPTPTTCSLNHEAVIATLSKCPCKQLQKMDLCVVCAPCPALTPANM